MKIAPILDAIKDHNARAQANSEERPHGPSAPNGLGAARPPTSVVFETTIVHTGQHYDDNMSKQFFTDLEIPEPDINLEVGSGSHAQQTAEVMKRFEPVLLERRPDVLIVVGDVNSTLACALVASKIEYPPVRHGAGAGSVSNVESSYGPLGSRPLIVHIEAGLRSFDRTMPEEVNRLLTDHVSDLLFVTEDSGVVNLRNEGVPEEKVHLVGNVMIDSLYKNLEKAKRSDVLVRLGLAPKAESGKDPEPRPYAVLTLHRPSNVDNSQALTDILEAVQQISKKVHVVFPCHPRTKARLEEFSLGGSPLTSMVSQIRDSKPSTGNPKSSSGDSKSEIPNSKFLLLPPLGYLDFLCLMAHARIILTDSGGMQEEAAALGVPCITLRENTERPSTIGSGTSVLVGSDKRKIIEEAQRSLERPRKEKAVPSLWDGRAAERIVETLCACFS